MSELALRLTLTRNYLTKRTKLRPKVAIIAGSGFGALASIVEQPAAIAYKDIPNFPSTTVPGHAGRALLGIGVQRTPLIVFDGRLHYYEGLSMHQVAYPVYVAQALGASVLMVTNAAGGIDDRLQPGTIMLIRDHLNFLGDNPLRGPRSTKVGPRFTPLHNAYDPALLDLALRSATLNGIRVQLGVYAAMSGPAFETHAELRALHRLGADAVGMSTVPEVIAARDLGMRVLALSVIANSATPYGPRAAGSLDHANVLRVVESAATNVVSILEGVIAGLGS